MHLSDATLSRATTALHRSVLAMAAIVVSLSMVSGTLALRRVEVVAGESTAFGAPRGLDRERWSDGPHAADRVIERQVRRAIRADPSLALAASRVKVTSRHGVVRLVGRVGTAKDRSSIAFKAGQNARRGRVDNRLTIGDGDA
jgi:osmotically-inducible protein OsmY